MTANGWMFEHCEAVLVPLGGIAVVLLLQVILDQYTRIVRTPHEALDVARTPP